MQIWFNWQYGYVSSRPWLAFISEPTCIYFSIRIVVHVCYLYSFIFFLWSVLSVSWLVMPIKDLNLKLGIRWHRLTFRRHDKYFTGAYILTCCHCPTCVDQYCIGLQRYYECFVINIIMDRHRMYALAHGRLHWQIHHITLLYYITSCLTVLHSTVLLYYIVLYCILFYSAQLYFALLYFILLYSSIPYHTIT